MKRQKLQFAFEYEVGGRQVSKEEFIVHVRNLLLQDKYGGNKCTDITE